MDEKKKMCHKCKLKFINANLLDISDYEMSTDFMDSIVELVSEKLDEINNKTKLSLDLIDILDLVDLIILDDNADR